MTHAEWWAVAGARARAFAESAELEGRTEAAEMWAAEARALRAQESAPNRQPIARVRTRKEKENRT